MVKRPSQTPSRIDTNTGFLIVLGMVALVAILAIARPTGLSFGANDDNRVGNAIRPITRCVDSDGGVLPNVWGEVYGTINGTPYQFNDTCQTASSVKEYYCTKASIPAREVITCPSGVCLYGVCQNQTSCTNECVTGTTQCAGVGIQTCGNYDADPCSEWGAATVCPANTVCQNGVCDEPSIPDVWVSMKENTIDSSGVPGTPFSLGPIILRGSERIDYLNGIQIVSTAPGADYNLQDISIIAADGRVIGTVYSLEWNGDHYYGWVMIDADDEMFPIMVKGSSFTIKGVITANANETVNIGIGGLNFEQPGAYVHGTPVVSDKLEVVTGREPLS